MKKSKNPFKSTSACISSDTSFSEYFQNASYSITSEESTQIISSLLSTENLSLKSVIFCLAIRKAYKNSASRYSKFAFYLMRSLYKESVSKSSKLSIKPKISKEKKKMLTRLQISLESTKEETLKRKILNFCKDFPRVKLVKIRRIETITKVFMIYYKSQIKKVKNFFLMLRKPSKIETFVIKLQKFLLKSLFCPKKVETSIKTFQFLLKPKHNLPYIKFASRTPIKTAKFEAPSSLKADKKPQNLPKKPDMSRLHQRAAIRLCTLNRNYFIIKKKVFYKLSEIVHWHKRLGLKNKAESFKSIFEGLMRKKYLDLVYRLASARRDFEYFKFLTQVLNFVKNKCENDLKLEAFDAIYACQRPKELDSFQIKLIYGMLRILNTKVFNKRFLAFILIKGFAKLNQDRKDSSRQRQVHDSKFWSSRDGFGASVDQRRRDYGSLPSRPNRPNRAEIEKAVGILDRVTFEVAGKLVDHSFELLKETFTRELYLENCWDFVSMLKKKLNRVHFYQRLESFESIKHYSSTLSKRHRSRALKLRNLLRRRYTKISALCFL